MNGEWTSARDMEAAGVRLFCLPHAGAGAAGYYRWKRWMPEGIAMCPVLLPGREIRMQEQPMESVSEIVDALHEAVSSCLDRPYAVFGHSMGALLAFAWVQKIAAEGKRMPQCLFVSGREAPQKPFGHRNLHTLGDEEFVTELAMRYGGSPGELLNDAEMRSVFLPILRADLGVVEGFSYVPRGALTCDVDAFAGTEDRSVSEEGLQAWSEVAGGAFSARRFPGDHFYHLGAGQEELLKVIAERLSR